MHTDAVQATAQGSARVGGAPVDLLTFSGHKVNGLKGAGGGCSSPKRDRGRGGAARGAPGGGTAGRHRERGRDRRHGKAFSLLAKNMTVEADEVRRLRDGVLEAGAVRADPRPRAGTATPPCVFRTRSISSFRFVEGEALLLNLDMMGMRLLSSGSACTSGSLEGSPILAAMGADRRFPGRAPLLPRVREIRTTTWQYAGGRHRDGSSTSCGAMSPLYHPKQAKARSSRAAYFGGDERGGRLLRGGAAPAARRVGRHRAFRWTSTTIRR